MNVVFDKTDDSYTTQGRSIAPHNAEASSKQLFSEISPSFAPLGEENYLFRALCCNINYTFTWYWMQERVVHRGIKDVG